MKGSIIKRGGTWSIVLSLGRDPATGKRVQKWFGGHRTRREAEQHLAELLHQVNSGTFVEPSRETVAAYLRRWLEEARPSLSAKTAERYGELIEKTIVPRIGGVALQKLQPLHLQSLYRELLQSGRVRGQGGLSPQTVLHVHRLLHRAFGQAVKWQVLLRNPAEAVEPPRVRREEPVTLSEEDVARLLAALEGTRYWAPAVVAATTALRRGEVLGLRWEDVDFERRTLTVRRSLEQTRSGLRLKEPKTATSRRQIHLPDLALTALRRQRAEQAQERLLLGDAYQDHGLVFAQADGGPLNPDGFSSGFDKAAQRAGFPHVHFHLLRHAHLSQLLAGGASVTAVAKRAGHSTPYITLTTYAHVLPGEDEEAARLIDQRLGSAIAKAKAR